MDSMNLNGGDALPQIQQTLSGNSFSLSGKEIPVSVSAIDELEQYGMTDISVAIGVFDGVHRGHRKLLTELLVQSAVTDSVPVAMTFSPHPKELLHPGNAPDLLLPPEEKIRLLHQYGVRAVVTIPFTHEFASLQPREFINQILKSTHLRLKGVSVGKHWRFGAHGAGDTDLLQTESLSGAFQLRAVDELKIGAATVSSTEIRNALKSGNLAKANLFLGRPYSLHGIVGHGMHIATEKLEHPTANLEIAFGVLPPNGVYAGHAVFDGYRHRAIANIGVSPTFNGHGKKDERRIEVHLLDFKADLYGKKLVFELSAFLRPERRFDSPEQLKMQIIQDLQNTHEILNGEEQR